MYPSSIALPFFIYAGRVAAMALVVARQGTIAPSFIQSSAPGAPSITFDWWPYDDFWGSLVLQPSSSSAGPSQTPTTTASSSTLSHTPPSPSPSIVDITALPPSSTNAPHPRVRTKENIRPFSLAPVFVIAGLALGALMALPTFNSYQRWATKRTTVSLLPGPAYVPVNRAHDRIDADRGEPTVDVHGSPSKHTRHGNPYSSYSVGRGLLGRIPSSRFRASPSSVTQERIKSTGSEKTPAWPALPDPSRSTPPQSRSVTHNSAESTRVASIIPDDPFTSTAVDTKSPTLVPASRTSTRSTFAHASRFGEMWSDDEQNEASIFSSPIEPVLPAEGEAEVRTGLFKKIRSKSKSVKRKLWEEKSTNGRSEPALPAKESSPRKAGRNFPWIPGSPPAQPDSYTTVPTRTSSPRPRSLRTPESSPRKPSHVRSSENVRMVDTSVLPSSPPTLTSPRWESELFLNTTVFDVPSSPQPGRTSSSRVASGPGRGKERNNTDTPNATSPSSPRPGEPLVKRDSRTGPTRALSTTSVSGISEFPGDPPPKRTAAERFYARRSALDKVEEIIQRSKSQTSVATMSPGRSTLDVVEESRQFGRAGREFEGGGIEQRLFKP